jgi:hypothetical protein
LQVATPQNIRFETWEIVGKAMGTHQIAFDFFTLISVTCVCPQHHQLWFTLFFSSPHFNAFGWASTKVQVHSRPTKGSGGLGTTKYFYKAKNVTQADRSSQQ